MSGYYAADVHVQSPFSICSYPFIAAIEWQISDAATNLLDLGDGAREHVTETQTETGSGVSQSHNSSASSGSRGGVIVMMMMVTLLVNCHSISKLT